MTNERMNGQAATVLVDEADAGIRLDVFLAQHFEGMSRRSAQAAIAAGAVWVNGRVARKGTPLVAGDEVSVAPEVAEPPSLQPNAALAVPVLYADSHLIALDKPAGMPSHALEASETDTIANFLLARFPECAEIGTPLAPGVVHRLDTETSGILLAARSERAFEKMREAFRRRRIEKEYIAVVEGWIAEEGVIRRPLAGDPRDPRKVITVAPQADGARMAETFYRPLSSSRERSVLAVRITTGVRHQIRAHLAAIGHPVIGDRVYGKRHGERRHLLHACFVAIEHPIRGERIEIRSAAPPEFHRRR